MASIYGPQQNGTYNFSVPIMTSDSVYTLIRNASKQSAPTKNPDGRGGRYFTLPYTTDSEKAVVEEITKAWRSEIKNYISKEESQYLQPVIQRLGGQAVYNPAGEIDGFIFRNANTNPKVWADADQRFAVAKSVVSLKNERSISATDENEATDENGNSVDDVLDDVAPEIGLQHRSLIYVSTDENLKYARDEVKQARITMYGGDGEADTIPLNAVYLKTIGTIVTADATLDPASAAYAFNELTQIAEKSSVLTQNTKMQSYQMLEVIESLGLTNEVFEGDITSLSDLNMRDVTRAQFEKMLQRATRAYNKIVETATTPLPSEAIEAAARNRTKNMSWQEAKPITAQAQQEADSIKSSAEEREAIALREEAIEKITVNGTKAFSLRAAATAWAERQVVAVGLDTVSDTMNTQDLDRAAGHERTMETGGYTASEDLVRLANAHAANPTDAELITRQLMLLRDERQVDLSKMMFVSPRNEELAGKQIEPMLCEPFQTLGTNRNLYVVEERAIAQTLDPALNRFRWEWEATAVGKRLKIGTPDNVTLTKDDVKRSFQYKAEAEHFLSQQGTAAKDWTMIVNGPKIVLFDTNDALANVRTTPAAFIKIDKVMTMGWVGGELVPKIGQWGATLDAMQKSLEQQVSWIKGQKERAAEPGSVLMPNGVLVPERMAGQESRKVYDIHTASNPGATPNANDLFVSAILVRQHRIAEEASAAMLEVAAKIGFDAEAKLREMQSRATSNSDGSTRKLTIKHALAEGGIYVVRDARSETRNERSSYETKTIEEMAATLTSHEFDLTKELAETERSITAIERDLETLINNNANTPTRSVEKEIAHLQTRLRVENEAANRLRDDLEPSVTVSNSADFNRDDEEAGLGQDFTQKAASKGIEWNEISGRNAGINIMDLAAASRAETVQGTIVGLTTEAMLVHQVERIDGSSKSRHLIHIVEYPGVKAVIADTDIKGIAAERNLAVGERVTVQYPDNLRDEAAQPTIQIVDEKLAKITKEVAADQKNHELVQADLSTTQSLNKVLTERIGSQIQRHGFGSGEGTKLNIEFTPQRMNISTEGPCFIVKSNGTRVVAQILNSEETRKTNTAMVRIIKDQDLVKRMESEVNGASVPTLTGATMTILETNNGRAVVTNVITRDDVMRQKQAIQDREERDREVAERMALADEAEHEQQSASVGTEDVESRKAIRKGMPAGR